ncbi:MAG TPA: dihydrolipoamide acetyltransferase family protein [Rugosimonospora sp.]|nr:dihydrolipoamide acetyltransferase family protein [Rugosimonospora sp.]
MPERIKEFCLPDLGEGLTEGEILKWLVAVGDTIELNQPIVEVETAKAAVEIPAKWAGRVSQIFHGEGTTVEVGAAIIAIDTDPSGAAPAAPAADSGRTPVLVGYGPKTAAAKRRPRSLPAPPAAVVEAVPARNGVLAKPPVRKLARDLGVDLTQLVGSGPQGSITRDDVQAALAPPAAAPAWSRPAGGGGEQRIPVKGVRKLTAENMVASAFTAPHVTVFLTVDVTRSVRALDRLRQVPEWRDVRMSPLLLVAKAVLLGLARYPMVNSTWAGSEIVVKEYVNLGIAAATERGLVVPNIKDAHRLSLRELADRLTELVRTAKSGRTAPADMAGGTFTITNVGVFGVDTGTPILPPGEAAILALGTVREAPWVHQGKIKVRHVTTLGLSFDHRIIDGELGSKFLRDVGAFLTDPEAALLAWA